MGTNGLYLMVHGVPSVNSSNSYSMKFRPGKAWMYVFKNDKGYVFLNRWDQHIGQFDTWDEAEGFATDNIPLIDIKIKTRKPKSLTSRNDKTEH